MAHMPCSTPDTLNLAHSCTLSVTIKYCYEPLCDKRRLCIQHREGKDQTGQAGLPVRQL